MNALAFLGFMGMTLAAGCFLVYTEHYVFALIPFIAMFCASYKGK